MAGPGGSVRRITQMRSLPKYLLSAVVGAAACGSVHAIPVQFDLPAQPAAAALIAFAKQANVEILFSSTALKSIPAPEVRGVYEPEQAVALLLGGTGFTATREVTGKFVVMAAAEK